MQQDSSVVFTYTFYNFRNVVLLFRLCTYIGSLPAHFRYLHVLFALCTHMIVAILSRYTHSCTTRRSRSPSWFESSCRIAMVPTVRPNKPTECKQQHGQTTLSTMLKKLEEKSSKLHRAIQVLPPVRWLQVLDLILVRAPARAERVRRHRCTLPSPQTHPVGPFTKTNKSGIALSLRTVLPYLNSMNF